MTQLGHSGLTSSTPVSIPQVKALGRRPISPLPTSVAAVVAFETANFLLVLAALLQCLHIGEDVRPLLRRFQAGETRRSPFNKCLGICQKPYQICICPGQPGIL